MKINEKNNEKNIIINDDEKIIIKGTLYNKNSIINIKDIEKLDTKSENVKAYENGLKLNFKLSLLEEIK